MGETHRRGPLFSGFHPPDSLTTRRPRRPLPSAGRVRGAGTITRPIAVTSSQPPNGLLEKPRAAGLREVMGWNLPPESTPPYHRAHTHDDMAYHQENPVR